MKWEGLAVVLGAAGLTTLLGRYSRREELVNSLEYLRTAGVGDESAAAGYVILKNWLRSPIVDKREIVNYLDGRQWPDGGWGGVNGRRPKVSRGVLLAYFMLDARPALSCDPFLGLFDTWDEAVLYGGRASKYHLVYSWATYYLGYPPWMGELFAYLEEDLDWTVGPGMHERTHILYNYVLARRPYPNLEGMVEVTLAAQRADGTWLDPTGASGSVLSETAIQVRFLVEVGLLYPRYTWRVWGAVLRAREYFRSVYQVAEVGGVRVGYFVEADFHHLFFGVMGSVLSGFVSGDVNPLFGRLYSEIA